MKIFLQLDMSPLAREAVIKAAEAMQPQPMAWVGPTGTPYLIFSTNESANAFRSAARGIEGVTATRVTETPGFNQDHTMAVSDLRKNFRS